MANQLYIPNKISVGFQSRSDTYTKKLAYVTYYDQKGVLRSESSWNSWRDHKIDPIDFENKPTEGFVLNKGVGGVRESHGWNARNEYVRVYDPRGFEFEISVANLLAILKECNCNRGKGLEGEFVYAWGNKRLILLPKSSEDFKNATKFTALQSCAVKPSDLVQGHGYYTKKQKLLTFLGRYDYYTIVDIKKLKRKVDKKFVFWDADENDFVYLPSLDSIAVTADTSEDVADRVQQYYRTQYGSKPVGLHLKSTKRDNTEPWYNTEHYYKENDDSYICYHAASSWSDKYRIHKINYMVATYSLSIINDRIVKSDKKCIMFNPSISRYDRYNMNDWSYLRRSHGILDHRELTEVPWVEPTHCDLVATLQSGSECIVRHNDLVEDVENNRTTTVGNDMNTTAFKSVFRSNS